MSVINKMLQDLDRRQALGAATESTVVRAPSAKSRGHEWFWRVLVVLLTAALAWMGWVAIQLLPRKPLVTELAFQAAAEAQTRAAAKPAATTPSIVLPLVVEEPKAVPATAPVEESKPSAAPAVSDALRLALQLETPIREPQPVASKPEPAKAAAAPKKAAPQAPAKAGTVDKRERERSPTDTAEAHFRRAVLLLNHGRVSEAEDQFVATLRADPAHAGARQAYVALLLEQRRVGVAHRLLQEALEINPHQPALAVAAARIYVGQREYARALEVLERAGPAPLNSEFEAMRGAVLQRLGRHGDAVGAYQNALQGAAQPPTTWIGLAISLEALGRRGEAVLAYRRALAAGPIALEAREYAESRARALE